MRPAPAATLLLLRNRRDQPGVEVYVTIRDAGLQFLGGYAVFPGGALDPSDSDPEILERCRGLTKARAERLLYERGATSPGVPALAYWVAACRELFEETGVLLARPGENGRPMPAPAALDAFRRRLQGREPVFKDLLGSFDLFLPLHRVHYFGHWITPPTRPMRFDTRFFLAALPAGQECVPAEREVAGGFWVTPSEALRRHQAGEWQMVTPTRTALRTLTGFGSVAEARRRFPHRPDVGRVDQPRP